MPYPQGLRVVHLEDGRTGLTGDCQLDDDYVCVYWEGGASDHIPSSYVRVEDGLADWERELLAPVTPAVDDSFRRLSDAFTRLGEAADTTTQQVSETPVGTANSQEQGGDMPEDIIRVPHTEASRIDLFHNLDMTRLLMQGLDEENWNRHLRELQEATSDIPWAVRRGSYTLDTYPTTVIGRNTVRLTSVPLAIAQEFTESASNSRVRLAPFSENDAENRFRLRTLSDLEDAAWKLYAGENHYMYADIEGGNPVIQLRALAGLMNDFSRFIQSDDRREYIRSAIRERMRTSVRAGERTVPEQKEWDATRIEKFQNFLNGVKARLQVEENPFLSLPILPHKTLSSRTWGIEIEAVHINGIETPEYWELKGDGSLRDLTVESIPSHTMPAGVGTTNSDTPPAPPVQPSPPDGDHSSDCPIWEEEDEDGEYVENDCECGYSALYDEYIRLYQIWASATTGLNMRSNRTQTGEWNSPVLRSYHSRGLKYLTSELEPRNTNHSAGVHVHVGAGDLTPEQAVQLTIIYSALEPLFESAYYRGDTRRFCQSVDAGELVNRFNEMRRVKKTRGAASAMRFGSRYWTVNLASLAQHKTVEFRSMGAVYNYEHLVRWAYFCREMVNLAKANVPQSAWSKVRTIKDLVTLFSKYGKETPTPEWAEAEETEDIFAAVVEGLGAENRRVPHTQGLTPGSRTRLVYDDYTSSETYFLGSRRNSPADREMANSF